jgi:hypothetical protein
MFISCATAYRANLLICTYHPFPERLLAIEIAGEKLSWTRETIRVWAADHDDWSAKVAGEGCKRPLEA